MRTIRACLFAGAMLLSAPVSAETATPADPQTLAVAAKVEQRPLTLERVFASPSLNGPAPRLTAVSPDGKYLTLLRNRADDRLRYDLWGYERATGKWRMLVDSEKLSSGSVLSEAEKMQRERQRIGSLKGIVSYSWSSDGKGILVPLDGDLYLAKLDGSVTRLTNTPQGELNPALSTDGRYLSFVRDGRLFVGEVGGAPARAITPEEHSDTVGWGVAEFVAQEELNRIDGYWWSPADRRIAVQRTDEAPVGVVTRTAIGAEETTVTQQRYPAAGTDNAIVSLHVMDPDGAHRVEVDLGADKDFYLARVDWSNDGKTLYVMRLTREQDRMDVLAADPVTGQTKLLFSETAAKGHWINLTDNYRWLKDGSLLWWSERDGFGHFYLYRKGKFRQLTKGSWMVTDLVGLDEKKGRVFFTANRDDPLGDGVYALDLTKPDKVARLTDAGFDHSARMDKAGTLLLISRNGPSQPSQTYLADANGTRLTWVEENRLDASHPYAPYIGSHVLPEFGTLKADDGQTLHWRMLKPAMEPGKRYPVLFRHYGGPHAQTVTRGWSGALDQVIVDKGYIVFELDNRGSANRGVAFEKPIYRAMGSVEVADQKVGAQFLKTLPFVDPAKIATYGWSYGGYMTLKMLEADQGLYAAGIAGAPVTKWEYYDTAYTERYMGDPRKVPEAYAKADALADAGKITDPLLLLHGMSDDNVILANSTSLAAKLQGEAVPFEMMFYPGQTHGVGGPKISVHLWHSIFNFLDRHGVTPPK